MAAGNQARLGPQDPHERGGRGSGDAEMAEPRPPRQRQADLALSIRRARPAEAGRLTEIAFAAKAIWGYSPSFMARCRASLAVDPADILPRRFHLAEAADGEVLGFYGFEPEPDGIGL